jgi:hypothetical protein
MMTGLLLAAGLAACSEPMEQPAPPPTPGTEDAAKTGKIDMPEIRDAEGLSPRDEEDTEAAPFFDPREAGAATAAYEAGDATLPDEIEAGAVLGRASGSFTAPGANETAWLVGEEGAPKRIVLVSIGGMMQQVDLPGAEGAEPPRIVAAPDTNQDGMTELVLYSTSDSDGLVTGQATHLSLRSGDASVLAEWQLLSDPCATSTAEDAEMTGSLLKRDEDTDEISEEPFSPPCD